MRLSTEKVKTIKRLSSDIFNSCDVYLFGSRVDDDLRGGDIDIYIQTSKQEDILKSKIIFLREFEKECGEQKVDLLIDTNKVEKEIFDIAKRGVKL